MCQFFSLISEGKGNPYYFDAKIRKKIIAGKLKDKSGNKYTDTDSHTSIASYYSLNEDKCNKYEYNPLTEDFEIDQTNTTEDSKKIERFCKKLDFQTVVPELILKPFFHPFKHKNRKMVTAIDIELLQKWASVWDLVGASVWDSVGASVWDLVGASVGASVWDLVGASVWDSVGASVWDLVRDLVWASVGASVGASVWDSVRDSVRDLVWAYASSFLNLPKWEYAKHKKDKNPFQPAIDLWHRGIVASFDGKTWRLHGYNGKILKEIPKAELNKGKKKEKKG